MFIINRGPQGAKSLLKASNKQQYECYWGSCNVKFSYSNPLFLYYHHIPLIPGGFLIHQHNLLLCNLVFLSHV